MSKLEISERGIVYRAGVVTGAIDYLVSYMEKFGFNEDNQDVIDASNKIDELGEEINSIMSKFIEYEEDTEE